MATRTIDNAGRVPDPTRPPAMPPPAYASLPIRLLNYPWRSRPSRRSPHRCPPRRAYSCDWDRPRRPATGRLRPGPLEITGPGGATSSTGHRPGPTRPTSGERRPLVQDDVSSSAAVGARPFVLSRPTRPAPRARRPPAVSRWSMSCRRPARSRPASSRRPRARILPLPWNGISFALRPPGRTAPRLLAGRFYDARIHGEETEQPNVHVRRGRWKYVRPVPATHQPALNDPRHLSAGRPPSGRHERMRPPPSVNRLPPLESTPMGRHQPCARPSSRSARAAAGACRR